MLDITTKSVFVNREAEMESLLQMYNESRELGEGRLIFISGEAGIGKTRLMSEFSNRLDEGSFFLHGACVFGEGSEPYLPFLDSLGPHMDSGDTAPFSMGFMGVSGGMSAEAGVAALGLMSTAEDNGASRGENVQDKKGALFESFTKAAVDLANNGPVVLFLDDFQWADVGSAQLLAYLSRNITNMPVLVCVAYRPDEMEHIGSRAAAQVMESLSSEPFSSFINLARLEEEHIYEMTRSILSKDDIPQSFLDMLFRESEGNPFFVEEVIKALVSEGVIDLGSPMWDSITLSNISIPRSIKDVISRRILRLDEDTLRVLRYAAIIGNRFSFDILRSVTELGEEDLVDHIDILMAFNLIHEDFSTGEEVFVFDHIQIITVVYEAMSRSRLRVMHKKVGEALEERHRDSITDVVYSLAKHLFIGKVPEKAVPYAILAAKKATASHALDEALNYYSMALNVIELFPDNEDFPLYKGDVLFNMGWVENMIGEWDSALLHYRQSIKVNKGLGNKRRTADAHRETGHLFQEKNNWAEAEEQYDIALKMYNDIGDFFGIADTYRGHSKIDWRLGRLDEAVNHLNSCIENAIRLGNDSLIGSSYIDLGNVFHSKGDMDKAQEHYKKAISILEKASNFPEMARAYNNLGEVHKEDGNFADALESYHKSLEFADKGSDIRTKGYALGNIGETQAKMGNLDDAEKHTKEALNIFERLDERYVIASLYMNYGIVYRQKKDWEQAETSFKKAMEMMSALNIQYDLGIIYIEHAHMLKDKGDKKGARKSLNTALDIFQQMGAKTYMDRAKKLIGEL